MKVELFVNSAAAVAARPFPVNRQADASKMAIGQERDAQNHPGREAFRGALARLVFWERPMSDEELQAVINGMKREYGVK